MSADRKVLNVLLAALDLEQCQLADAMGYQNGYLKNVFNNFTPPSAAFKRAFGDALADLLLGDTRTTRSFPAAPLADYLSRRASSAPCRTTFYADLGLSISGWSNRRFVTEQFVDRICCELGVHPTAIYGDDFGLEPAR